MGPTGSNFRAGVGRCCAAPAAMLIVGLLGSGCATRAQQNADEAVGAYFMGDYHRAIELLRPAASKPDENFVLNNDRLGSAALAAYDLDMAERALLRSYEVLN